VYTLDNLGLLGMAFAISFVGGYDGYVVASPCKFNRNLIGMFFHASYGWGEARYNLYYVHVCSLVLSYLAL
jgi:hypothetical protein